MSAWSDTVDLLRATWARGWRWVVWSPWRLAATLVVAVLALVTWSGISGGNDPVGEQAQDPSRVEYGLPEGWEAWATVSASPHSPATSTTPSPSSTPTPTETGSDDDASAPADTKQLVRALAGDFATAYLADQPRKSWLAGLSDLTTPALSKALLTVDQANLPPGPPRSVELRGVNNYSAVAIVQTSQGSMTVEMAFDGRNWRVTAVQPPQPKSRTPEGSGTPTPKS